MLGNKLGESGIKRWHHKALLLFSQIVSEENGVVVALSPRVDDLGQVPQDGEQNDGDQNQNDPQDYVPEQYQTVTIFTTNLSILKVLH